MIRANAKARTAVAEGLRQRLPEIEEAILNRIRSIADGTKGGDLEYDRGMKTAVTAWSEHVIVIAETQAALVQPTPIPVLAQVRLAARRKVSVDTVLRRCVAAQQLFTDFLVEEAERRGELRKGDLRSLLRAQAAVFDDLLTSLVEEYGREARTRPRSSRARLAESVRRLLGGELVDCDELAYELEAHHLGIVAIGADAVPAMAELANSVGARPLVVQAERGAVWAWLGTRAPLSRQRLDQALTSVLPARVVAGIGEPAKGLCGWRLTHRQAAATLPIAKRHLRGATRYADVAVVASIEQDELLATSLRRLYVEPLETGSDAGRLHRETLRAYFAAGRNGESAAHALGVTRQTVSNRIRRIEECLGRSLSTDTTDLEIALRLAEGAPGTQRAATAPRDQTIVKGSPRRSHR